MNKQLQKVGKILTYAFIIFAALFLILTVSYMTEYRYLATTIDYGYVQSDQTVNINDENAYAIGEGYYVVKTDSGTVFADSTGRVVYYTVTKVTGENGMTINRAPFFMVDQAIQNLFKVSKTQAKFDKDFYNSDSSYDHPEYETVTKTAFQYTIIADGAYRNLLVVNDMLYPMMFILAIVFVLFALFDNHKRRKYYLSNLFIGVLAPLVPLIYSFTIMSQNNKCIDYINKNYVVLSRYDYAFQLNDGYAAHDNIVNGTANMYLTTNTLIVTNVLLVALMVLCVAYMAYTIVRYVVSQKKVVR